MDNIAKPITIAKEDFVNNLIKLVNSSQLPLFIVEYVLKDVLNEVHTIAVRQLQLDKDKYESEIKMRHDKEKQNDVVDVQISEIKEET